MYASSQLEKRIRQLKIEVQKLTTTTRNIEIQELRKYRNLTQEELADRLRQEGFQVTQATVSRDIRELKLSKIPNGRGKQKYVFLQTGREHMSDKYIRIFSEGLVSMEVAQNILVIRNK